MKKIPFPSDRKVLTESSLALLIPTAFLLFIIFYVGSKNPMYTYFFYLFIIITSIIVSFLLISKIQKAIKVIIIMIFFIGCAGLYIFSLPLDIISNYYPSYWTLSLVKDLSSSGHLSFTSNLSYEYYPALIILSSITKTVTSLGSDIFFKFFPTALFFLSIAYVLRSKNQSHYLFALLLFNPWTIVRIIQFSPQFFAIILIIYLIIFLQKSPNQSVFKQRSGLMVIILFLFSIVIANITWSLMMALFLFFFSIFATISYKLKMGFEKFTARNILAITLTYIIFVILWYLIAQVSFTGDIFANIINTIEMISNDVSVELSYVTPTSAKITGVIFIEYAAFAFLGLFNISAYLDRKINTPLKVLAFSGLACSVVFMGYWFLGAPEGTDLLPRGILMVFLTSSPMLASHITGIISKKYNEHSIKRKIKSLAVFLLLALTMLNAVFYPLPPDVYDYTISPTKESTRFSLYEWIGMGDFLDLHAVIKEFYGVRLAQNLISSRYSMTVRGYEISSSQGDPIVITSAQLGKLNEITPNSFHILRKSMDNVSEWTGNGTIQNFEQVISPYNILYTSGDPILIQVLD